MRILALDAALGRSTVGVVVDARLIASRVGDDPAAQLPAHAAEVLAEAGFAAPLLDLIAVTVGPGSFTGIRAALALAHGLGLAARVPIAGVSVAEALAPALPHLGARSLWTAINSRPGRVFLDHDGAVVAHALESLPTPPGPVAVAGDAAIEVAARLAARGADVMLTDARYPLPRHVALAGAARHAGQLPPRPAQPLYVDAPLAKLPAGGLRPPPAA